MTDVIISFFFEIIPPLLFDCRRYKYEPKGIRFLPAAFLVAGLVLLFLGLIFDAGNLFMPGRIILAASFIALMLRFLIKKFREKKL